jgi:hypothetical protein
MTEEEWLAASNVRDMLAFLAERNLFERQVGLWIVACCRQVQHLLDAGDPLKAIDAAERYVEEEIQKETLMNWRRRARHVRREMGADVPTERRQACDAIGPALWSLCGYCYRYKPSRITQTLLAESRRLGTREGSKSIEGRLAGLLRDCVGNPFQRRPAGKPAWLAANGGLAGRLANSIYDERKFGELPILADALEDAGCAEAMLLEHLRGPGPHERGCWALDVILGRG